MSKLYVATCDDLRGADEIMGTMTRLQQEHRIDLDGGAIVQRALDGTLKVRQAVDTSAGGVAGAYIWYLLLRAIFKDLFGADIGLASIGTPVALNLLGIDDRLVHELADRLDPGTSAVIGLVGAASPDSLLAELHAHKGRVLRPFPSTIPRGRLQRAGGAR